MPVEDANANENHEEHDSPHDRRHAESSGNNSTFNLDDVSALMASLQRSQAETFKNIMSYVMEQRSSTPAAPPMPPVNVDGTLARCKASFSGAPGESVEAFIDAIESYTECVQVSDANIIRGLAMLLSADAATWWLGLKHHISTWNEAKENLIYAYGTRLPPHRVYLEIFASPQVEENTDKFVARVRALMAKLPRDDISEKVQLDMVYGLLHNRIRTRLRREEFTSFNSLLSHARNIEDSLEETQPRPSTSGVRSTRAQPASSAGRHEPCVTRASAPARARYPNSAATVVPASATAGPVVARPAVATPTSAVPGSTEQSVTIKKQRPVCSYCKRFGHTKEQCRKLISRGCSD
ncbi:activity-regulated cytoskeleton associated protein 1-like [Papilio machaon]|uniref:activity-regulated cytoskeleton associated protein 1-like n=1 Tax=Papilio machaon TaxID=76193 RepID=UPI001E663CD5|nr:activity-regulated cytoskeleton associated protein 1-like [Papilio machaon]